MTADLDKLHSYVSRRIAKLDIEREAMYERLPLKSPTEALATRLNELDEALHALTQRIAALEDAVTKPAEETE